MKHRITVRIIVTVAFLIMVPINYSVAQQTKPKQENELLHKLRKLKEQRKKEREDAIKRLEKKLKPLVNYSIEELQLALTIKVIQKYQGAKIYSDEEEPQYLGTISDEFDAESIFNEFGRYGSEFSSESIWNDFGTYGSEFSPYSPFNQFSSSSPIIVKGRKIIGRLTVNKFVTGAVDPNWLKSYFKY